MYPSLQMELLAVELTLTAGHASRLLARCAPAAGEGAMALVRLGLGSHVPCGELQVSAHSQTHQLRKHCFPQDPGALPILLLRPRWLHRTPSPASAATSHPSLTHGPLQTRTPCSLPM